MSGNGRSGNRRTLLLAERLVVTALLAAGTFVLPFFSTRVGETTYTGSLLELTPQLYEMTVSGILSPDLPGLRGLLAAVVVPTVVGFVTLLVVFGGWLLFLGLLGYSVLLFVQGREGESTVVLSVVPLAVTGFVLWLPVVGAGLTPVPKLGFGCYAAAVAVCYAAERTLLDDADRPAPSPGDLLPSLPALPGRSSGSTASSATAVFRRRRTLALRVGVVTLVAYLGAVTALVPDVPNPGLTLLRGAVVLVFLVSTVAFLLVPYYWLRTYLAR